VVILAAQVALFWLMCVTMSYWVMGRNYESAVMPQILRLHARINANAISCMEELVENSARPHSVPGGPG